MANLMGFMKERIRSAFHLPLTSLALSLVLGGGCAHLGGPRPAVLFDRPEECGALLSSLEEVVDREKVRDTSTFSIPGFPYLRTSRFLTALGPRLEDLSRQEAWINRMRSLDRRAREKEIGNLSDKAIAELDAPAGGARDRAALFARAESCAVELRRHEGGQVGFRDVLFEALPRPMEYSLIMRIMGLYPLASLPVMYATNNAYRKIKGWREIESGQLPVEGELRVLAPPLSNMGDGDLSLLFETSRSNPLDVPYVPPERERELFTAFAPVIVQDTADAYDRPGRVVWEDGEVEIDTGSPTVYYYTSRAFLRQEPVLQLNYVFWYPARAGPLSPWIERGRIDGTTIRLSLSRDGSPFMADIMNNCGCYHFFAPSAVTVEAAVAKPWALDPFVPEWLPDLSPGERLTVRINSGWHQVQRLSGSSPPGQAGRYTLVPYRVLEELPRGKGRTRSIFSQDGILRGSERIEPYILFSMGVPEIGAMRQRGHHPILLVGHSHFDDPELFNKNFTFRDSVTE